MIGVKTKYGDSSFFEMEKFDELAPMIFEDLATNGFSSICTSNVFQLKQQILDILKLELQSKGPESIIFNFIQSFDNRLGIRIAVKRYDEENLFFHVLLMAIRWKFGRGDLTIFATTKDFIEAYPQDGASDSEFPCVIGDADVDNLMRFANLMRLYTAMAPPNQKRMEHSVRVIMRLMEGRPNDFPRITFGGGSKKRGLNLRPRRRSFIYHYESHKKREVRANRVERNIQVHHFDFSEPDDSTVTSLASPKRKRSESNDFATTTTPSTSVNHCDSSNIIQEQIEINPDTHCCDDLSDMLCGYTSSLEDYQYDELASPSKFPRLALSEELYSNLGQTDADDGSEDNDGDLFLFDDLDDKSLSLHDTAFDDPNRLLRRENSQ